MSGPPTPSQSEPLDAITDRAVGTGADAITIPGKSLRRTIYCALVILSSLLGGWMMTEILSPGGLTLLEVLLLLLFLSTFTWVLSSFWSAFIGFVLQLLRLDPYTLRRQHSAAGEPGLHTRTAVVMPVYNENTARVIAGFEGTIRSLAQTGQHQAFDFYLLSDTQDPALISAERVAWRDLRTRLGCLAHRVYYRHREKNTARKVGNLADFCQRWGSHYDFMIILDADSVMTGDCMVNLAARMEANPGAGLIQTIPIPARQQTFFGRFIQFAAALYSPLLATGYAFWQADNANYWGHNAIIRIAAFIDCCGLPTLHGRPPFGGEILSHDFVEAALLYRGGWAVYIATDLEGSYEEVPANIIDYAKRDRRWVQGNLQHLALLTCPGFSPISRLHFLFGALAYGSSLSWLCMLIFSTIDAILRATSSEVFFNQTYQLFPSWPTAKPELIVALLYLTVVVLFAPKVMGMLVNIIYRRQQFGGILSLLGGAVLELIFAIVVAPLMMLFHARFVLGVLLGFSVDWEAQPREGRMVSWREAWARGYPLVLIAAAWVGMTVYFTPVFFCWISPVLFGLLITPALIHYSSSKAIGRWTRQLKLLLTPIELSTNTTLQSVQTLLSQLPVRLMSTAPEPTLPPERWKAMPIQLLQIEQAQQREDSHQPNASPTRCPRPGPARRTDLL